MCFRRSPARFEIDLQRQHYNLLTGDPHCVAALVNDCSVGAPLRLGKEANVILYEGNAEEDDTDGLTDPEYVWYKVTQPIAAGEVVWGTYGDQFFRGGIEEEDHVQV